MKNLTLSRHQLKKKTSVQRIYVKHQKQIGDNSCWAASATMLALTVEGGYHDEQQTRDRILSSKIAGTCTDGKCILNLLPGTASTIDWPLCLSCNEKILNMLITKKKYVISDHSKKKISFDSVCEQIKLLKPIEAYCQAGMAVAHFSIIHGTFSVDFNGKILDFLMIADPLENGLGVCDFNTFIETGKYKRTRQPKTSLPRHWTRSFI
jgi:hypothetical protein